MAKKKEQRMTSEELLAEALVKEEDWPYEVPGNWVWTRIGFLFDVTSSKRVFKNDWTLEGIPFYRTRELVKLSENGYVDNELYISEEMYEEYKNKYGAPLENDLLISGVGTIGKAYAVPKNTKFYFKDGNIIWFKNKSKTNAKYIFYLYKSNSILNQIKLLASGSTVDTYTIISAKNTIIPLPPFAEQQRIVDRIKSLFVQLDQAKDLIQDALDSFETRKAAILHQAFTGELTKKWRAAHGVGMESWEETVVGNLCKCIVPGRDKPRSFTGTIPWITIPNIKGDFISNTSGELFLTNDEINEVRAKIIPIDSVVMTCVGRFGISAIVADECVINQQLHAFLPSTLINNRYLMHNIRYLKDYMEEKATSTTIAYLNKTACNSLPINLPTMKEQDEIVRILDDLFVKEQNAKDLCDLIDQIEAIKKTILGQAFRGELGTNVVWEASEVEMLKESILSK